MPPFVFLAIVGAGAYAGYRLYEALVGHLEAPRPARETRAAEAHAPRDLGPLEWDAEKGVYRPRTPKH